MSIQLSDIRYIDPVFKIFTDCKKILEEDGIYQWSAVYPSLEIIQTDIMLGHLYNFNRNGECVGAITINTIQDEQYQSIEWDDSDGNPLIIHRLAVSPPFQGKGIASMLMDFSEDFARNQSFSSIRLEAYSGNPKVLDFYERRGYVRKGNVYFSGRSLAFYCYEKLLKSTL